MRSGNTAPVRSPSASAIWSRSQHRLSLVFPQMSRSRGARSHRSGGPDDGFESPGHGIEVVGTLFTDRVNLATGFFAQLTPTAIGTAVDAALSRQHVEVSFLDLHFGTHSSPVPIRGQFQPGQHPRLDLLPRLGAKKTRAELLFELIESLAPSGVAVTVDAQKNDLHHAAVAVNDFGEAFGLQRLAHAAQQRILADPHYPARFTQ